MAEKNLSHRSSAKAALRELLEIHSPAGVLGLLAEVFEEKVPRHRGRPTRDEAVSRVITKTINNILPDVITLESKALNARTKLDA